MALARKQMRGPLFSIKLERLVSMIGFVLLITIDCPLEVTAANAPGAPGAQSVWAPSHKDFIGTSASTLSRVAFTGAQGILTEVFYPTLDKAQNVDLQFIVTDGARTWGQEERRQRQHEVSLTNRRALEWKAVTTSDNGEWRMTKNFFTDPGRNCVVERVQFEALKPSKKARDYHVYILRVIRP
jgi:glucoamylase